MNAPRDNNRIPVFIATLDSDGSSAMSLEADPSTHAISNTDLSTGSDNGNGSFDANSVPVAFAVSNSDETTPVALYIDSSGNLLIDSS